MSFQQIATLDEYVIVAQERREVTIFWRANHWVPETFSEPDAVVEFRSIKQSLMLAEIYETSSDGSLHLFRSRNM